MGDKPKVEITETERIETPKLGLQDRGQVVISCNDCGKPLMVFQIAKNNADLTAQGKTAISTVILIRCSICGGISSRQTIDGMFYPGAAADNMGFEPLDEEINDVDVVFRAWRK